MIIVKKSKNDFGFCLITNNNIVFEKFNLIKSSTSYQKNLYSNRNMKWNGLHYAISILVSSDDI